MKFTRHTVAADVSWTGQALHSGVPVTISVHPGQSGIWFRCGSDRIEAIPSNVTETTRSTRLGQISTIEHLMSALAAQNITDAEVELTTPEMPALDGAAAEYFSGLDAVGKVALGEVEREGLFARVFEQNDHHQIAIARGEGWFRYTFLTGDRWPCVQDFEFHFSPEDYASKIASARTFAFAEEVDMLRANGMGQGLDESNALILGSSDYVNQPKFADEPVRHKILDLIGDLYLAGIPPQLLSVVAERSGHTANVAAARKLKEAIRP